MSSSNRKNIGKRLARCLLILWLVLVAGLPAYYLMPDCDWNYEYWGAPEEIVKSHMSPENPVYQDEGVYSRIFIVRPSAQNLLLFRETKSTRCAHRMDKLLRRHELPGPYRCGSWFGHGRMDYVQCGNGLVLMRDYSRNKGGLFSSRMKWNTVTAHYPLRFICMYIWAAVGLCVLILTPFLLLAGLMLYALARLIISYFKAAVA